MNEPLRRSRKNRVQNVLIVLLSLSAAALFFRTQALPRAAGSSAGFLSGASAAQETDVPSALTGIAAPVRLAVIGAYGRYGSVRLTTADEAFAQPGSLLRMALGSAGGAEGCSEEDFRSALSGTSLYYDFTSVLPLSVLGGFVGAETSAAVSARRLLLAEDGGNAVLYLSDGTQYRRCSTAVSSAELEAAVSAYQLGNAAFAYELNTQTALDRYSLLLTGELPDFPVLSASPVSGADAQSAQLTALGFNPHTNSRYTDGGTEVVMDGERTVRLEPDGEVIYRDGSSEPAVHIVGGQNPTAPEAVLGAWQLLCAAADGRTGDAALYLRSATADGDSWTLTFDYQSDGTPILRGNGGVAAQVTLRGTGVTSLSLWARSYTAGKDASLLLPLTQALAVAEAEGGADLKICYTDSGADAVSAGWVAE